MVRCLTGARFTMRATILHQNDPYIPSGDIDLDLYGEWVNSQDPLTGEIVRVWKPYDDPKTPDENEDLLNIGEIRCLARGIVDGGIRVAGTTERFGDTYANLEYVKLWTPANVMLSKRDRVTNIRMPNGKVVWVDDEFTDPRLTETPRATVFNVNGVTPLFDALNRHVENFILLERAEVYSDET